MPRDGPGEFSGITDIKIGALDSIWVFNGNRTFAVFTQDGRYARSGRLPSTWNRAVVLPGSQLLYPTPIRTDTAASNPLHLLRPDGNIELSFGNTTRSIDERCLQCLERVASVGNGGVIWVAWENQYRIERWVGSRLDRVLTREPPWFPPRSADIPAPPIVIASDVSRDGRPPALATPVVKGGEGYTPQPRIRWIVEDQTGLLWVVILRPFNGPQRNTVDVIDPRTADVLATNVLPEGLFGFWHGGVAWSRKQSADGYYSYEIWQLRLKRN